MTNDECLINVIIRNLIKIVIPSFLIFHFSFFICFPVLAEDKDLIINANNLSYDRDNKIVTASGSVEIIYRDVTVHGRELTYNSNLNRVWADRGFTLCYGEISIEGKGLDYNIKVKGGQATDVTFKYQGVELSGKTIALSLESFDLKNATFSTCDLFAPHYRVTASEILLYPDYGWLVAYWGFFWLGPVPVVPMPTYIYDLKAAEKAKQNLPPFPEIGRNDEDGTFVNERLAWHLRRELSGTYSLTYAAKKGFGGGVSADYLLNEDSQGNTRLDYNPTNKFYGGVTHSWMFGPGIEPKILPGTFSFGELHKQKQYRLDTTVSYHERINYQRISFYPDLRLRSWRSPIFRNDVSYDYELAAGQVAEQNNTKLARGSGKFNLYWAIPIGFGGEITPSLGTDQNYYSNNTNWLKNYASLEWNKTLTSQALLGLNYLHYFSINGTSPFLYELYHYRPADKLTGRLKTLLGETGLGLNLSYFLDTWQPEDIDYSLTFRMHCYDLQVLYRSLRNEFSLGFSLAGG
jgi:hypothetical protein